MKLPPYPKYKPSGVEWLGDVPEHWETRKFSREVMVAEGQVDPEKEPYLSMLLVGPEHVESGTGRLLGQVTAAEQAAESGKYYCRQGDVIYSKIRPALRKLVIAPTDCLCSADMYPLRARQRLQNEFIYWLFLSQSFAAWSVLESDRVAMPKINRDTINELRMPVPPIAEQRSIVAYLDRETGRVDRLVAKKRELIERLKEKRTALISRTVTRGLLPAAARAAGLPVNPPLKASGIEWLGEIPKHWQVKRLKFELWRVEQGWSPQCDNTPADEGEWGVLKAGAVNGPEFDPNENKRLPDEEQLLREFEIKAGDFLISRANTRELLGSAALVRKVQPKLLLCDKLYRLTIRKRTLNPEFLLRFMRSTPGHFEFERDASGSSASMQNIGQQSVRNLRIPVPPLPEQAAIAAYLDEETSKLDALVGKVEEAIERLQEYRTALITAAVTGKIDVRSAVEGAPSTSQVAQRTLRP